MDYEVKRTVYTFSCMPLISLQSHGQEGGIPASSHIGPAMHTLRRGVRQCRGAIISGCLALRTLI